MPDDSVYDDIETFLRNAFEENYELLVIESGHALTADVKETALQQVLLYWRKLRHIAERITETEVRLSLPMQITPQGREYTIEGVVDIVREDDRVVMYDIKTQEAGYVRSNLDLYRQQLNLYAHIWQELRRQRLDEMAIIATDFPSEIKDALSNLEPQALEKALSDWDPIIPIEYDSTYVTSTLYAFGETVDKIENGEFAPPPLERLEETIPGVWTHERFGTRVCRQCDARFSCDSYRRYAKGGRLVKEQKMTYFIDPNPDQESWRTAELQRVENNS